MKLHKFLTFPGGYKVKLKHKRSSFFTAHGAQAMWDEDRSRGGTIRLNLDQKKRRIKLDLRHELGHVFVDWIEFYLGTLE